MRETAQTIDKRPDDHFDNAPDSIQNPKLGVVGWLRWAWRLLTSMRTALVLLLLVAIAAIPGSLVPQRTSDPNGVALLYREDPARAEVVEFFQLFNVYTSVWFSAIYLLLFISLIGCVIPRTRIHWAALRQAPPRTPMRFSRLPDHSSSELRTERTPSELVGSAARVLRRRGYRTALYGSDTAFPSVAGERGYLRETGNLLFHISLIGILLSVAVSGGFKYTGQRVIVEGETFTNARAAFDSFTPGTFFQDASLPPFSLGLEDLEVRYLNNDPKNLGFIIDYIATVSTRTPGAEPTTSVIRVNEPLTLFGIDIFLLGNGYAPSIVVRDPQGRKVLDEAVAFLPQDGNLTSLGVVKVPDGLAEQVGIVGFFYPTQSTLASGASSSVHPDLVNPVMTLNVFTGDLGIDDGTPKSVYALDTATLTQLTGGSSGVDSLQLRPGETVDLPNGLGTIEFVSVARFASFDMAYDPTKIPVLVFTVLGLIGLGLGLFVPRRRVWFRFTDSGEHVLMEGAALARGDDPRLGEALGALTERIGKDAS